MEFNRFSEEHFALAQCCSLSHTNAGMHRNTGWQVSVLNVCTHVRSHYSLSYHECTGEVFKLS